MPKRVLIVEDNPFSLELTSELIQAKGHQVICATSGTEAIPVARALQAGCIAYLRRPLDTRRFLDLMERLLGEARQ